MTLNVVSLFMKTLFKNIKNSLVIALIAFGGVSWAGSEIHDSGVNISDISLQEYPGNENDLYMIRSKFCEAVFQNPRNMRLPRLENGNVIHGGKKLNEKEIPEDILKDLQEIIQNITTLNNQGTGQIMLEGAQVERNRRQTELDKYIEEKEVDTKVSRMTLALTTFFSSSAIPENRPSFLQRLMGLLSCFRAQDDEVNAIRRGATEDTSQLQEARKRELAVTFASEKKNAISARLDERKNVTVDTVKELVRKLTDKIDDRILLIQERQRVSGEMPNTEAPSSTANGKVIVSL